MLGHGFFKMAQMLARGELPLCRMSCTPAANASSKAGSSDRTIGAFAVKMGSPPKIAGLSLMPPFLSDFDHTRGDPYSSHVGWEVVYDCRRWRGTARSLGRTPPPRCWSTLGADMPPHRWRYSHEGVKQLGIQPKGQRAWHVAEDVRQMVRSERGKTEGIIGTLKPTFKG